MRLARIITEYADESLELAMQLRARGFEVETVLPNQIPETPADIEIQLDACNAKDVLERVMEITSDDGSYVFVAPGALDEAVFQRPGDFVANGFRESVVKTAEPVVTEAASSEPGPSGSTVYAPQHSRWFEESVRASDELPAPMVAKSVDTNEPQEAVAALEPPAAPAEGITIREVESTPRLVPSFERPSGTAQAVRQTDAMFWRIAIVAAALAVVVVVAGSVWQRRRPTPSSLPAPASQRLPFHEPVKVAAPSTKTPDAASGVHAAAQDKTPAPRQSRWRRLQRKLNRRPQPRFPRRCQLQLRSNLRLPRQSRWPRPRRRRSRRRS